VAVGIRIRLGLKVGSKGSKIYGVKPYFPLISCLSAFPEK